MPGSVQVSGDQRGNKADDVPAFVWPTFVRVTWCASALKYICLCSYPNLEPLTTQIPRASKSHDWVDDVLLLKSACVKRPTGATKPVYEPSCCSNVGTWPKEAGPDSEQPQYSRSRSAEGNGLQAHESVSVPYRGGQVFPAWNVAAMSQGLGTKLRSGALKRP